MRGRIWRLANMVKRILFKTGPMFCWLNKLNRLFHRLVIKKLKIGKFWRHLSKTEEDEDKQILIHSVIIHRFFWRIESHKKSKRLENFFLPFLFNFYSSFLYFCPGETGIQFVLNTVELIRTPKRQSEVSLERCPYKRGHYDDVTFMTPLTLSVQ